jgi:transposase-like protein
MNAETGLPETLHEAIQFFATGDNAFNFLVARRWPNGVVCPTCGSSEVSFVSTRKVWECKTKHPKRQFSVKVGTIFEDSPIALDKWFAAMWLVMNCKNGVSSYEISRELGVTQKTGWFMLHRIRRAMESGTILKSKMNGIVEADEAYIGGQAKFMHKDVKRRRGVALGHAAAAKTAVMGLLQRPTESQPVSKVLAIVLPGTPTKRAAMANLNANVEKGAEVQTDMARIYEDVRADYAHKVVDHVEAYVQNNVHTNGLENFWCLLKRAIKGTYVSVEPCHLHRYVSEQVIRFNSRKEDNHGRFLALIDRIFGLRLTYKALTESNFNGLPCQA